MASSKWLQLSLVTVCYLVDSSFLQMPPLDKVDKLGKLDKSDKANKFTSFQSAVGSQTDQDLDLLGSSDVKDLWKGDGVESERGNSEVDEERPWIDLSLYSDEDGGDGDSKEEGGDSEEVDEEESDEEENVDESEEETSRGDEEPSLRDITKFPVILKAPVTCHKFLKVQAFQTKTEQKAFSTGHWPEDKRVE